MSTFYKLSNLLDELIKCLKHDNNYDVFQNSMIQYMDNLVKNGEDINCRDSEENEIFLSLFFYRFFDYGDDRVYNCKVYNPYVLRIFKHCLDLGANLSHKSYNSRYGHNEFEPEPIYADIMRIIMYEFDEMLEHQNNDEDSFLIYEDTKLIPFRFHVPDDPYIEYTESEMNQFYLMKFRYLSEMLYMVFEKMNFIIPHEYNKHLIEYIDFIEVYFVPLFPSERKNALKPLNWYTSQNFNLFILSNGFYYKWSFEHTRNNLLAFYKIFEIDEIVNIISSYL